MRGATGDRVQLQLFSFGLSGEVDWRVWLLSTFWWIEKDKGQNWEIKEMVVCSQSSELQDVSKLFRQ